MKYLVMHPVTSTALIFVMILFCVCAVDNYFQEIQIVIRGMQNIIFWWQV
jgi:hypothetical protein